MKIRNGFVSNSSSSSFVLAYDKTKVLTDPKDIVDFVDNNLRAEILMHGTVCCEGDDWFFMDNHQKNYLLKRAKRFCKYNKGTHPAEEIYFDEESKEWKTRINGEVPYIEAYTDIYAYDRYEEDYRANPDMSGWDPPREYTPDEYLFYKNNPQLPGSIEFEKCLEYNERYYEEERNRRNKLNQTAKADYMKKIQDIAIQNGANPDNLIVKSIAVDNNSCDPDGNYDCEFAPRYFGLDEKTYYELIDDIDEDFEE